MTWFGFLKLVRDLCVLVGLVFTAAAVKANPEIEEQVEAQCWQRAHAERHVQVRLVSWGLVLLMAGWLADAISDGRDVWPW